MPFCPKCGIEVGSGAAFCPACGAPQPAAVPRTEAPPASIYAAAPAGRPMLAENAAGALCYVLGWVSGLVFFFLDKRPFVRFHATQSIVVFGGLHIVMFAFTAIFGASFLLLYRLLHLLIVVLWIVLIIKAYQGQRFRLPLASDVADGLFGKQ